jgi:hypothetical protein
MLLTRMAAALVLLLPVAQADTVESVLMPGQVIEGHAKIESDCKQCHKRFDKHAQSGLCMDCHKDIARDAIHQQGYHGRIPEQECRACHTEHKGRAVNIAPLDEKKFDHRLTDFLLKGAHLDPKVPCRDCHPKGKKHRDAPSGCVACHRQDDKHKGALGPACADCHTEKNWKDTRFDHSKTRFALTGKHRDVPCKDCHADPKFKGAPMQCVACHRQDDQRKGHKGRFGDKCQTCHTDRDWKSIRFEHDRDTRYPLKGKHRFAKCAACHTGFLYKEKTATQCAACHRQDDERKGHRGKFGNKCESCHVEKDWSTIRFDHDRQTKYPLRGKHAQAKCSACHRGDLYRDKLKSDCLSCHLKDDKHKGQQGKRCESCHNEREWKTTRFDHGLSRFPLLGKHAKVECKKCHLTPAFKDAKADCHACHEKDDAHKRRLGTDCGTCHNARDWKAWSFDHDRRTRFPLDGAHRGLDCLACHKRPMTGRVSLSGTCASCHDGDDAHHGSFGRDCQRCHLTDSFKRLRPGMMGGPAR